MVRPVTRGHQLGVVALLLAALLLFGCANDDSDTARFETDGQRTLPSVTTPSTDIQRSVSPSTSGGEDSTVESDSTTTEPPPPTTEPLAPLEGLATELVADGFDNPVFVTGAPGTDALFVTEQDGVIQVLINGQQADRPFMDISDRVGSVAGEQGLLGLAFHPDYESNGRFYAYWTDRSGNSQLAEFNAPEPTLGDPTSEQNLLSVGQPSRNHNGGMIEFGPDGLLYVGLGDGGGRPGNRSQDTETLLGSILRLDVSLPGTYSVPADNPFGNEIWVYGLRNPWRFAIDFETRDMYIADVGQDRFEEIDLVGIDDGAAVNFGWPAKEGDSCFGDGCDRAGFTDPILQYPHPEGCSITGGYVYRGSAIPEMFGHYFYADFCGGLIRSFRYDQTAGVVQQIDWSEELGALDQVASFGVDNDNEMYAVNASGQLLKIIPVRN